MTGGRHNYKIIMGDIRFEWDLNKAVSNQVKHGISFEEAATAFFDGFALLFDDPDHSLTEERFMLIGMTSEANICVVSHCYREQDVIRIISARRAARKEYDTYFRHRNRRGGGIQ